MYGKRVSSIWKVSEKSGIGLGPRDARFLGNIIHNLAHLLYSNVNRSCFAHPLCDLSQDRQLSGLRPSS